MKRCYWMIASALVAVTVCGCIPRRLFWSPDGKRAAIIAEDGLRLSDAVGKLSEPIAQGVGLVSWFPDSRRFVASQATEAVKWEDVAVALSPERREALIKLADRLREEVLAYSGDWNKFKPKVAAEMSDGELAALLLYVRDHRRADLPEKLGDKWKELEKTTITLHVLHVYEISGAGTTPGSILAQTLDQVWELRVAPDGGAIACVVSISGGDNPVLRLSVVPAGGGALQTVAEPVSMFPDWTPDGRSLVYATTRARPTEGGDSLHLGTVTQRRVRDLSGELLKEFHAPEDLVGVVFGTQTKIRCLSDGRVVFSAMEVTLPTTSKDMPQRASLFSIDPGKGTSVTRMISREAEASLPDGLGVGYFELSPDAARVAVAASGDASVSVLTLATGAIESVVAQSDTELKSIPAWRTSQELSLFVPPKSKWGSPNRYELVLWSGPDKARCLSRDWPNILEKKSDESTPTSAPAK